jgi:hypothetical protein
MKCPVRFKRLLVTGTIAAAAAAGPLASVAHAEPEAPTVPTEIEVEAGNKVFLVGHATGVQIYRCNATSGGYRWDFVAPRADLFDDHGKFIANHFGGPTWQAKDGSKVVGQLVRGVVVDQTAIAWLKLSKASSSPGPAGDRLAGTSFIQRTATVGGLAPAAGTCVAAALGDIAEIPYTADYHFWKGTLG